MKIQTSRSLRTAVWLLQTLLPSRLAEEVSGDVEEEFGELCTLQGPEYHINLWQQTLSCVGKLMMTKQRLYSLTLALGCGAILFVLIAAINFLSVSDDPSVIEHGYWLNGNMHLFFGESVFWQSFSNGLLSQMTWDMYVDLPSVIYAVAALVAVFAADKRWLRSVQGFALLALASIALPYFAGMFYIKFSSLALNEVGPVVAFMWLAPMYLLPVVTATIIKKRHQLHLA